MKRKIVVSAIGFALFSSASLLQGYSMKQPKKPKPFKVYGVVGSIDTVNNYVRIDTSRCVIEKHCIPRPTLQIIGLLPDVVPSEGDRLIIDVDSSTLSNGNKRIFSVRIDTGFSLN